MSGKTTPLYVVCSPRRSGGKTLVSRLLTEFYVLGDRPVAAFDLCDERPQLADYLPQFTTIAEINDIHGQMAFFERLIAENEGAKIIDVSHRIFKNFFTIAQKISLFEEARRHCIEPLILFVIDADPKSPEVYATIRRWFPEASLLPVRNMAETIAISTRDTPPKARTAPASLEVPLLSLSLRALIDRQYFSLSEFWRAKPANLPDALDDELRDWVECVFFQFRDIELSLGCEDTSTRIAAPASRHARTITQVPEEVRKFAPKKMRRGAPMDQSGNALVNMLRCQLQSAEDRIDQLETASKQWQDRAVRAQTQLLQLIQKQI
jgi:hypothetical protein